MEDVKRLFKEAERLKPGASLWTRILAGAATTAGSTGTAGAGRDARLWRLAASLALGLGMVAALAVLFREPPGLAARENPEESAAHRLATADTGFSGTATGAEGLLEWHADLGIPAGERFGEMSAEGWADDAALFDPLLEE